ncbi:small nuclear ribonucleoprotein-associated protein B'-like [Mobula birostris]|uniref:small nuclear ribonucleoprotein-associated protein B'-like n=1 Tax=Mobula birostris TaxID=1983395 RepID=UPI003B27CCDF
MTSALESYINRTVAVVTADGRMIVGTLKGFDQTINLILDESHERVFSSQQGVEQVVLGLYIVREDNVHRDRLRARDLVATAFSSYYCRQVRRCATSGSPLPEVPAYDGSRCHSLFPWGSLWVPVIFLSLNAASGWGPEQRFNRSRL